MINVLVEKTTAEGSLSVLKRFTRKVQGSGVLNRVRSIRYKERNVSKYNRKKGALKQLRRKAEIEELIKLGKIQEKTRRQ